MSDRTNIYGIRSIAILRTDRIGEVLLATPVIEALKKKFPKARISFVTSSYSIDIVFDRTDLSNIITFDTIPKSPPLIKAFTLADKLKRINCDMAIVLNPHKVLHLGVFLAGIKYRVGFDRKWGFLLNIKTKDTRGQAEMHEVAYNLRLLRLIDIYEENIPPFIPVLSKSSYYVSGLLEQSGITGRKKIIVVHPGSSNPSKMFPVDKFKAVIKLLVETGESDIVIIGSRDEKALALKLEEGFGSNVHNLSGLFTLRKLCALLKRADLFITNDNGPMHIAAAVGTKVLALFNKDAVGSNPLRWGPYGDKHTVIYKSFKNTTSYEVVQSAKKML
jgi:ADP-heptose:LPS heptosyltransferase